MTFLIFNFLLSVEDELLMNVTEIRRLFYMVKIITLELAHVFIKEQVGDKKVLLALSGGVDFFCSCSSFNYSDCSSVGMCPCKSWFI